MDLRITITDENSDTLEQVTIYQDGSDSEGAAKIIDFIRQEFVIEGDEECDHLFIAASEPGNPARCKWCEKVLEL